MNEPAGTLLICCGALAREIVKLVETNGWSMRVDCLPAHLHNTPERIPEAVREKIHKSRDRYDDILVLYSDCGTGGMLDKVLAEEGIERINGSHCYEVFCGSEAYQALIRDEPGCFFLTDFLTRHFDRLIIKGLALDRFPKLRSRYFGKYRKVVYLAQTRDPELKANESFQHLQARISSLEESIADRREFYNESVNQNNIRIAHFPDVLIARFFNFGSSELLEFDDAEKADVDVKALFE